MNPWKTRGEGKETAKTNKIRNKGVHLTTDAGLVAKRQMRSLRLMRHIWELLQLPLSAAWSSITTQQKSWERASPARWGN